VLLEVVGYFLRSQIDAIYELLIMRIPLLGWSQDFRDVIDWALNFVSFALFFSLDCEDGTDNLTSGRNVQEQWFVVVRSGEHRLGGKQGFELNKRCLCFSSPLKQIRLLHQSVKGQCLLAKAGDESAQSRKTTRELLYSMKPFWTFHSYNCTDLFGVGIYPLFGNEESE
jgi:hypothetical protein